MEAIVTKKNKMKQNEKTAEITLMISSIYKSPSEPMSTVDAKHLQPDIELRLLISLKWKLHLY